MGTDVLGSHLGSRVRSPDWSSFHDVVRLAAAMGRPAVPELMVIARDSPSVLGRLCAIATLERMGTRLGAAKEALVRISRLPVVDDADRVYLAAASGPDWPPERYWDPYERLRSLGMPVPARVERERPVMWGQTDPPPSPDLEDGWWREQE